MIHPWLFVVTALAAYRLQRIVTADTWPPSQWFRDRLAVRFGPGSSVYKFFECPWCFGTYVTAGIFVVLTLWPNRWVLMGVHIMAACAIVGMLAEIVSFLGRTAEAIEDDANDDD